MMGRPIWAIPVRFVANWGKRRRARLRSPRDGLDDLGDPAGDLVAQLALFLLMAALVLLMTPALGFFYGGLVRSKNALNTMMMSVASLGFVGVSWALVGGIVPSGAWSAWSASA